MVRLRCILFSMEWSFWVRMWSRIGSMLADKWWHVCVRNLGICLGEIERKWWHRCNRMRDCYRMAGIGGCGRIARYTVHFFSKIALSTVHFFCWTAFFFFSISFCGVLWRTRIVRLLCGNSAVRVGKMGGASKCKQIIHCELDVDVICPLIAL